MGVLPQKRENLESNPSQKYVIASEFLFTLTKKMICGSPGVSGSIDGRFRPIAKLLWLSF